MENLKEEVLELDHEALAQREDPLGMSSCGCGSERAHRIASSSP